MDGNQENALALVMMADRLAAELISEVTCHRGSLEEVLQILTMAAQLVRRIQPNQKRAVEAMLEAEATLSMVSGDLVSN